MEAINHSGWRLIKGSTESELGRELQHWDYQTTLSLAAALSVDRDAVLESCELSTDTELRVVVTAQSDGTNAHGRIALIPLPPQSTYDLALDIEVPGHTAGGRLHLDTLLVCGEPRATGPLAPRRVGSVLWRTRHVTHLEGSASRFPTDAADFRETRPTQSRSVWALHLDTSNPDLSFLSAARVTLNTAHEDVQKLLAGDEDAVTRNVLRMVRWDVTRQLVLRAITWDEISDDAPDHEGTSIAAVLRSLLAQIWPLDRPSQLRQRYRLNPELIELQVQHFARVLP